MKRTPDMEPLYAALHKNLAELELRLREANPSKCKGTASKIDFLKALLAAEMEAHAGRAPPLHILHLSGRLRTVERALRDWEDFGVPLADGLRDVLACPCTHKCCDAEKPETEREEKGCGGVPEPEDLGTLAEEKVVGVATEWDKNNAKGEKKETEHDRQRFRCRFIISSAAAVAPAVFGVLAMSFYRVDEEVFLVPT